MLIIFRQGAARAAQSHAAELEQKEGWYDGEGWRIDDPASAPGKWWFPDPTTSSRPLEVVVGTKRDWSLEEWKRAASTWEKLGKEYGLTLTDRQLREPAPARRVRGALPTNPTPEQMADEGLRKQYLATTALHYYKINRSTTNFAYFLASAEAEAKVYGGVPITMLARKTLWKADRAHKAGNNDLSIRLYKDGLEQWKRVLTEVPPFASATPTRPQRARRGRDLRVRTGVPAAARPGKRQARDRPGRPDRPRATPSSRSSRNRSRATADFTPATRGHPVVRRRKRRRRFGFSSPFVGTPASKAGGGSKTRRQGLGAGETGAGAAAPV